MKDVLLVGGDDSLFVDGLLVKKAHLSDRQLEIGIEKASGFLTHEINLYVNFEDREIDGSVIKYGEWVDLDSDVRVDQFEKIVGELNELGADLDLDDIKMFKDNTGIFTK